MGSDIDDTVKITELFKGREIFLRNSFLREFRAVKGMSDLYRRWVREYGANFKFVSKSPPEFHEPLREFLIREGFPGASLSLCPLFGLERKRFKEQRIATILAEFPARQFVLVGDSGEADPEIYAEILRKHPYQIIKIIIREVDPACAVDPAIFEGIDAEK